MNPCHLYFKLIIIFFSTTLFATPSEYFENKSLLKLNGDVQGVLQVRTTNNTWSSSYPSSDLIINFDRLSLGYTQSIDGTNNNRNAYFIKWDQPIGNTDTIGLKYIHDNWYFLESGKESLGVAYNSFFEWGGYFTIGYFHRWLKQKWDPSPYSPLNFDTDDHEGFMQLTIGWKYDWGSSKIFFDINNRDYFAWYGSDNWATDFKILTPIGSYYLSFLMGIRWTSIFGISPHPGSTYASLGLHF